MGGRASTPMERMFLLWSTYSVPWMMASMMAVSSFPRKMEMMAGGAS